MKVRHPELPPLILVIHDQPDWSELLQAILLREGYRTVAARDGAEGLILADALQPDLILLELALPVMDGLEFLSLYRQDTRAPDRCVPVVAMTAIPAYLHQALDLGAAWALKTPIRQERLLDLIQTLISRLEPPTATPAEVPAPRTSSAAIARPPRRILEQLARVFRVDAVSVAVVDGPRLRLEESVGRNPVEWSNSSVLESDCPCHLVLASGQWLGIGDLAASTLFSGSRWRSEQGWRAYAGVPLLSPDGGITGTLALHDSSPRIFHHSEKQLLLSYAGLLVEGTTVSPEFLAEILPSLLSWSIESGVPCARLLLEEESSRPLEDFERRLPGLPIAG